MSKNAEGLRGSFIPSHAMKLALVSSEAKPKEGAIVTVAYQRGRGGEAETVTGQYPVRYVVDSHGDVHLVVLGEKCRTLQSFCW